jgi:hypothetical protein
MGNMNRRTKQNVSAVTGNIEEACMRYSLGRSLMRETAEKAGAIIKVGRIMLIHYGKVDKYLESLAGNKKMMTSTGLCERRKK